MLTGLSLTSVSQNVRETLGVQEMILVHRDSITQYSITLGESHAHFNSLSNHIKETVLLRASFLNTFLTYKSFFLAQRVLAASSEPSENNNILSIIFSYFVLIISFYSWQ